MTPVDMEAMIRNLDTRATRIEQILPTLATREDLREVVRDLATKDDLKAFATKDELREGLAESKRYTQVLIEDVKSDIRLLAEHLVHVAEGVERLERRL